MSTAAEGEAAPLMSTSFDRYDKEETAQQQTKAVSTPTTKSAARWMTVVGAVLVALALALMIMSNNSSSTTEASMKTATTKGSADLKMAFDFVPEDVSIQGAKVDKSDGNTPPPSPSVILYTLHPTYAPSEEPDMAPRKTTATSSSSTSTSTQILGEIKPLKKSSNGAAAASSSSSTTTTARGDPVDVSIQGAKVDKSDGNTPPPSPSVILYTLHPTATPSEETS